MLMNSAEKQWIKCWDDLSKINDFYSRNETIELLNNNYREYFGKSGNRKLLRDNKKLYLSLYHHTANLDSLNRNLNKFSMRLYILINNIDIYCNKHNHLKFWKFNNGMFTIVCSKCEPKYPSIEWFKKTYGDNWDYYHNQRKSNVVKNKANSLDWFKSKHGEILGEEKYRNYVEYKMIRLSQLKANRYSKISQNLFWEIYDNLDDKSNIYFHDLNSEFVLKIPKIFKYKKTVMMLDFKQNNKIIEYNGKYWHNDDTDNIRYSVLKKMGFKVLVITSDEYNRNNKNKLIIDKCINFLQ